MLDDIAGAYGSRFFLAAGGVAIALVVLIGVLWLLRNRAPSPFVRGGKNRQPRLQVLDAAAVDARRRLVLVRRDGIEHLIMIGGPTDIVIETGISDASKAGTSAQVSVEIPVAYASPPPASLAPARQPEPALEAPRQPAAIPQPPARPQIAVEAEPVLRAEPAMRVEAAPKVEPTVKVEPARKPEPVVAAQPAPVAAVQPAPAVVVQPVPSRVAPVVERPDQGLTPQQRVPQSATLLDEAEAADILDAARQHVLPQAQPRTPTAQQPAARQAAAPAVVVAPVATPAVAPAPVREPGGDFQRVLEAEMSNNLKAERIIPNVPPHKQIQQQPAATPAPAERRDPEFAPITGSDSALQKEVARIFGEMSVNRDK
ncbi:MAG: flagellar biosynthetic protein FliO [Rhizobiaceae bacterium]|nr:flagellar biosynthetic protein FliO [Rhizobiaceae bacterium]